MKQRAAERNRMPCRAEVSDADQALIYVWSGRASPIRAPVGSDVSTLFLVAASSASLPPVPDNGNQSDPRLPVGIFDAFFLN